MISAKLRSIGMLTVCAAVAACIGTASADWVTTAVDAASPWAAAVNPVTNKIYVVNPDTNIVTVIDGATNATTSVTVGSAAGAVAVNPVTNKIYVTNFGNLTVFLIVKPGANP